MDRAYGLALLGSMLAGLLALAVLLQVLQRRLRWRRATEDLRRAVLSITRNGEVRRSQKFLESLGQARLAVEVDPSDLRRRRLTRRGLRRAWEGLSMAPVKGDEEGRLWLRTMPACEASSTRTEGYVHASARTVLREVAARGLGGVTLEVRSASGEWRGICLPVEIFPYALRTLRTILRPPVVGLKRIEGLDGSGRPATGLEQAESDAAIRIHERSASRAAPEEGQ